MTQGQLLGLRRTGTQPTPPRDTGKDSGGREASTRWQPLARTGKVIGQPSQKEGF